MDEEDPFAKDIPDIYLTQLLEGSNQEEFKPYNGNFGKAQDQPTQEHLNFLLKNFGHQRFRPMQWKIISSIIKEKRDNLAIMTTGYGKSLCYQYPSAFTNSITIVISPLISLMEDQILSLTVSSIPACLLGSAQTQSRNTIDSIFENKYRVIYLTPEYCTGDAGVDLLKRMERELKIALIAIDEAHCVTSWGHDFRYSYRNLSILKEIFPNVPILAVTATATPKVKSDIIKVLKLKNPQVLCTGFDRPNLYFCVFQKSDMFQNFKDYMVRKDGKWTFPGPTIIYCLTRQQTTEISDLLKLHEVPCVSYHAGMSLKERKRAHEDFVKDKVSVIAATIAFGMGIDKPDIRLIIHWGASNSIEGYYQEVGRAGRDGLPAKCVVFWSGKDFTTHSFLRAELSAENQARKAAMADLMRDYLTSTHCRRYLILSHFEDNEDVVVQHPKNCCDNCGANQNDKKLDLSQYEGVTEEGLYDFTEDAVIFLNAVSAIGGKFGMEKYILFIRGSKSSKLPDFLKQKAQWGSGAHKSDAWWKEISNLMLQEKFLDRQLNTGGKYSYTAFSVSKAGRKFLKDVEDNDIQLLRKPSKTFLGMLKKIAVPSTASSGWMAAGGSKVDMTSFRSKSEIDFEMDPADKIRVLKIYHTLIVKRTELAREHDVMPYTIASNAALMHIAKKAPENLQELKEIHADGFTEAKIEKFGPAFIKIILENGAKPLSDQARSKDSIQNILKNHPIPDARMPSTAYTTVHFAQNGHSVEEIMAEKKLARSTVIGHLVDAMKCGFPVTLSSLGVSADDLHTVVGVVNNLDTGYTMLTSLKMACPEHITYEQIKAVCAFLKIRDHLKTLGVPYEEFDKYDFDQVEDEETISEENNKNLDANETILDEENDLITAACDEADDFMNNHEIPKADADNLEFDDIDESILLAACDEADSIENSQKNAEKCDFNDADDDLLLAACDEMEKSFEVESNKNKTSQDTDEPQTKKYKMGINTLLEKETNQKSQNTDEPHTKKYKMGIGTPLENETNQESSLEKENGSKNVNRNSKKQKLPPWLIKKRVA